MADSVTFGPFSFDAARGLLLRDGVPLPVGNRAIGVLSALLEANGDTLGKDELMAKAWPGTVVEEANLTVQIAALRKAMGPTADGDDWILTVARVGYRLPRPKAESGSAGGLPVIAVLPFANLSNDAEQDFFADGITEDLITGLSRFRSFSVLSRGSTFAMRGKSLDARQAGELLGARYLLEGSVRRAGESIRVSAQLADAATGEQLWAERFDGTRGDIFAMQDRITETVIGLIQPQLQRAEIARARRRRPENLDAYDLYLRALPLVHGSDPAGYETAITILRRAIALAPGFSLALAYAAWSYEKRMTLNMPPLGHDDEAEIARLARLALLQAADDPHVLVVCGWLLARLPADSATGLAAVRRAYAANPNDLLVLNLAGFAEGLAGDLGTSRTIFERAIALAASAPENYMNLAGLASVHLIEGNFEEALKWGRRSLETSNDWPVTCWVVTAAAAKLGQMDEAHRYLARLRELLPTFSLAHVRTGLGEGMPDRLYHIVEGLELAGLPET